MSFTERDLAGYRGKEIAVNVCQDPLADPGVDGEQVFSQIRGAQSFNTTEERPSPDLVAEMGFEATKAIYGPVNYSLAIELLVRDLVQIARLSGINPSTATKLNVSEFTKTNAVAWFKDPDTGTVRLTKIACGFKARTASTPMAVGANATVTLEGAVDVASSFDGKASVVQYVQEATPTSDNGRNNDFAVAVDSEDEIYQVEKGEGVLVDKASTGVAGWKFTDDAATPSFGRLKFVDASDVDEAPAENAVIRIVYKEV